MGVLTGEVVSLKKLDLMVSELKEQLKQNRRDNSSVEDGVKASRARQSREIQSMEEEPKNKNLMGYQQGIARYFKLDFLKFSGEDVKSWLFRVKQFFKFDEIAIDQRVGLASIHLEGGLTDELNLAVKLTNPTSLPQVFKTARMQEAYLTAQAKAMRQNSFVNTQNFSSKRSSDPRFHNKPLLSTPNPDIPVAQKRVNRRRLSIKEMNGKRAQGLCYFYSEKYNPGHKCTNLK
ncbi:hypothetical protein T459_20005 [Capsicum annuum]|uniref:Retrotransposon gag domain-containing protein n=1 Tax=Capsicum annuum TaxID=4072 RepID=A0A2G2Z3D2_CAPAN|nr:hypothetical protein T459_20005 [Capsicum annuum]